MSTQKMIVGMITVVLVCWAGSAEAVYPGPAPDTLDSVDAAEQSAPEGAAQQPPYKPGEIIVKFKKAAADNIGRQLGNGKGAEALELSASLVKINRRHKVKAITPIFKNFKAKRQRMQALLKKDKGSLTSKEKRLLRRLKRAPKGVKVPDLGRIYKIELAPGQSAARAAAQYNRDPDVEYAELNYVVSILVTEPNDPNYSPEQWALHNDGSDHPIPGGGSSSGTSDCDIDAPEAWDIQTGSRDVTVAVLDTGVDYGHNDLSGNMWFNKAELNGDPNVDDDNNGYVDDIYGYDFCTCRWPPDRDSDPNDDHGHGTHCAGIIAADGNNGLDVTGINWDANVMALKFLSNYGYGWNEDAQEAIEYAVDMGADIISNSWGSPAFSQSLKETCDYAYSQGVFIVAAAGNDNDPWPHCPACYDSTMSVAATDHDDNKASFSCYGNWTDVAAPGVDILSLRSVDGGGSMHSTYRTYPYNDANATMCIASGTSMACPHVAGLAALCLAEDPNLAVGDLWVLIKNGADDIDDPNDPNDDNYYGSGRINAYTTINYISSIPSPNQAASPYPANSATNISINVHLSWTADDWAASHDVYFGTSFNDVNDANTSSSVFKGNQRPAIFDPNTLSASSTYYWRVDEKNYSATTKGDVWSFTTGPDSVIYVDVDATGNNDGTSWANAFTDLKDALAKAFDDDQVWVAEGTYKPDANDANVSFEPHEGVSLYGGFEADETDPNQRDPNIYNDQSILSGDIGTGGDANDNSYHVVKIVGDNRNSVLFDRFKITGGNADLTPGYEAYGGGMLNILCSVTLKDCLVTDNYAIKDGGGIFNGCASAAATNSTLSANKAYRGGGMVIYVGLSSGSSLTDCTFEKNDTGVDPVTGWFGGSGGGLYARYDTVTITDCAFADNNSLRSAGAIWINGTLEISGSTIQDNNSAYSFHCPGGIDCVGDLTMTDCNVTGNTNYGMFIWSYNASVSDCEFSENDGIGIYVTSSEGTIENCTFDKNNGPGVRCASGSPGMTIRNCVFTNNVNTSQSQVSYHGGGISNYRAFPTISNCTFSKNSADYGGAIYNYSDYGSCSPEIRNCVLWNNAATTAGDEIYNGVDDPNTDTADPNISYCDVNGCGGSGGGWDPNFGTDCGGNIDQDPCFVNPDSNDFHLKTSSPCIDVGDCNGDYTGQTDMDGEPRVQGVCVDMGADEVKRVYNVDKDKWYVTIQAAIDDAAANNEIVVYQGTYLENVDFGGKAIKVRSTDPGDSTVVAATVIDGNGTGNVLTFDSNETSTSILEGLTIADGNRGVYCSYTSPAISKCVISGNVGGGTDDGGGMYNYYSDPNVLNCTFTDNEADDGGAMANYYGDPCVLNCTFTDNNSTDDGAGMWNYKSSPDINQCLFTNNTADDDGGGMYCDRSSSAPTVTNCVFAGNTGDYGGGMCNWNDVQATVINCVFYNNTAVYDGGAMFNEDQSGDEISVIINCTFFDNYANDDGGAVYHEDADTNFTNCILWGNVAGDNGNEVYNSSSDPVWSHCDIDDCGESGSGWDEDFGIDGGGNTDDNPEFVDTNDPDGADDIWGTSDDGLIPTEEDCDIINEGDNDIVNEYGIDKDIKGDNRIIDDDVDMGAYENTSGC